MQKEHKKLPVGNIERGKDLFIKLCADCHSSYRPSFAYQMDIHRKGPNLYGLLTRKCGRVDLYFNYSPAMRHQSFFWDEQILNAYLKNPERVIPGMALLSDAQKCQVKGIEDPQQRADLLKFVRRL